MFRQKSQECAGESCGLWWVDCHERGRHAESECKKERAHCDHNRCMLSAEAVREIRAAIDDELSAVAEYATLARKFKHDPVLQAWITSIAGDEYGHARAFSMVLAAAGCADEEHCPDDDKRKCC